MYVVNELVNTVIKPFRLTCAGVIVVYELVFARVVVLPYPSLVSGQPSLSESKSNEFIMLSASESKVLLQTVE